jgi:teichuronic acid biosynthesis glycosyltransferase TuaC
MPPADTAGAGRLAAPPPPARIVARLPRASRHRPIRLLTFSTLYPNQAQPSHGVFVENRLRHLIQGGAATSTVLAPVPWFPWRGAPLRAIPASEQRHGLAVHHPRFLAPPKLGMFSNPYALYRAARAALGRLRLGGQDFDLIDGHYLYPDGVAAIWLGRDLGLKVVLTARGSDTSQLPDYRVAGRLIRAAIDEAAAVIAVSADLKAGLVQLGAPPDKVTVLRNGVDLAGFAAVPGRDALRAELGLRGPTLLSVGHLIDRKRNDLTIAALPSLPGHTLLLIGDGPDLVALRALAARLGVSDRVTFLGRRPHAELPRWYTAADLLVLASSREGWANVLLEAMACGTPVLATPAWGSREAVSAPAAGLVLDEATPAAIAAGVRRLLAAPPDRAATRRHAEGYSWDATTEGQLALFDRILEPRG